MDTSRKKWSFLDISFLGAAYRYDVKIGKKLKKNTTVWVWEPLIVEGGKGKPQPTQQRIEKIWTTSRQLVESTSKEGKWKEEERYQEVV
jgi:hypothetical protein